MIPVATKQKLREKFNNQCVRCKTTEDLSIDHIVPKWLGGTDHFDNLQVLCRACNWRKGNTPPFWVRVRHLFSGFFYKYLMEIKGELSSKLEIFTNNQLKINQSNQDLNKALHSKIELAVKSLEGRINILEFEAKALKTENIRLNERLRGIEDYNKIHWVEETIKEYRKND
jgi:hypothetical protein